MREAEGLKNSLSEFIHIYKLLINGLILIQGIFLICLVNKYLRTYKIEHYD